MCEDDVNCKEVVRMGRYKKICRLCLRESEEVGKRFWKCYPNFPAMNPCPYPRYIRRRLKEEGFIHD